MHLPLAARIAFFVVFLALASGMVLYLDRRLLRDVTTSARARLIGGAVIIGLAACAVFARMILRHTQVGQGVALAMGLWIGLILYTVGALVAVDLGRAARNRLAKATAAPALPSEERRLFLARSAALTSVAAGGGLAGWGAYRAYTAPEITEYTVRLPGLPKSLEGFTIAQLSDVHVGQVIQAKFMDDLVERTNAARPDLVAITGDLVDGKPGDLGQYVARLRNLRAKYGTFFSSGNHDFYSGWEDWSVVLAGFDMQVLKNRHVSIGDAGGSFDLVGVEDYGSRFGPDGYSVDKAVANRDPTRASVLLSHQPGGFDDATRLNLGLQLSGHTHGGQMFPATLISQVIWGSRNVGLSKEGNSQLIVSRGCGFVGPPMRLGSPPEVVKIILLPA